MYNLNLNGEEYQALTEMLECSISQIHSEIIHTDHRELKEMLKNRKQVLVNMLESVRSMQAAPQTI
jgi:hypothetical protein